MYEQLDVVSLPNI